MYPLPPERRGGPPDAPRVGTRTSEAEYLDRLSESQTPIVVCLKTGETFRGYIEYYDQRFIRLTRNSEPNLFIFKQDIKYLYEE